MDWNDLKHFLAVARSGSLTEAGRRLRVSQATVARRIAALEAALRLALFQRRTDGYHLTEEGRRLVEVAEQAEAQMLWIERGGPGEAAGGVVRFAMPELLGNHFILPRLAGFLDAHPEIGFEVTADVRPARLTKGEADLLVRLARPESGGYAMKRIGRIALGLFASADYLARYGTLDAPLRRHRFIGWDAEMAYLPMARWLEQRAAPERPVLLAHTMGTQLAAAGAGMGIALLPAFVAYRAGLRPAGAEGLAHDVWLLIRNESRGLDRVRRVTDHVEAVFAAEAALLSGG